MRETSPNLFFCGLARDIYEQKYILYPRNTINVDSRPILLCACETIEIATEEDQDGYGRCNRIVTSRSITEVSVGTMANFQYASDQEIIHEFDRLCGCRYYTFHYHANQVRAALVALMMIVYKRFEYTLVQKGYRDKEYTTRLKAALLALDYHDRVE